jgi:hypothetical protein
LRQQLLIKIPDSGLHSSAAAFAVADEMEAHAEAEAAAAAVVVVVVDDVVVVVVAAAGNLWEHPPKNLGKDVDSNVGSGGWVEDCNGAHESGTARRPPRPPSKSATDHDLEAEVVPGRVVGQQD